MSDPESQYVRVHVDLHGQKDAPVAVETLWAVASGDGAYRIDNIPFFATGICDGDVAECQNVDGELWFVSVVQPAPRSVIRVVWNQRQTDDMWSWLRAHLMERGCTVEMYQAFNRMAVVIPAEVELPGVMKFLEFGVKRGLFWVDEATIRINPPAPDS